jgi:hypothetical protein
MTKKQAIKLAGSGAELGRIVGASRQVVHSWAKNKIPELYMYRLKEKKPEWFLAKVAA